MCLVTIRNSKILIIFIILICQVNDFKKSKEKVQINNNILVI